MPLPHAQDPPAPSCTPHASSSFSPPPLPYLYFEFKPPPPSLPTSSDASSLYPAPNKQKIVNIRAELKGDGPKVTEPNLRFPAVFCENLLRFSARICGFLRFPAPSKCLNSRRRGESAKICGFLRESAFWARSVTLVPSP